MFLQAEPSPELFISSQKIFLPGEQHITRVHRHSVLILMLSGRLAFLEEGRRVELVADEYYIQRPYLLQEGVPLDEPPVYIFAEFDGCFAAQGGLALRGVYNRSQVLPAALQLCRDAREGKNRFLLASHLNRVFAGLCVPQIPGEADLARRVREYMESNYAAPLTLAGLAQEFNYSSDHICRVFARTYGCTPHRHLIKVRLEHALRLLESTGRSVSRIAADVGYSDFSAFHRAFKARYHCAPSACRQCSGPAAP